MFAKDLTKNGIVDSSYESVFLGRRCCRSLDPNFKVSQEEILEIINEAQVATPTAVDSMPYTFLIIESDEAKKKLDSIMWPVDKDRVTQCSFAVIPMADREWLSYYDDICEANKKDAPGWYEFFGSAVFDIIPGWWDMLHENNGIPLDKSISFQAGLISQSLMIAARAHGLDSGFMDAWSPEKDLGIFDVDLERFIPEGVICFGKNIGKTSDSYRLDMPSIATFL